MPDRGLDEEKLRVLARWATGLQRDPRPEVVAAGRAIEMLVEEIDRLHVLLWNERLQATGEASAPTPAAEQEHEHQQELPEALRPLRARWRLRLRSRSVAPEPTGSTDFPQAPIAPSDQSETGPLYG